jgi:hypothetical protein
MAEQRGRMIDILQHLAALTDDGNSLWTENWFGSPTEKGSSIWGLDRNGQKTRMLLHVGETEEHHSIATAVVSLHNECAAREAALIALVQEAVGEIERLNKKISTLEWAIGCKDKQILQFSDAINEQGAEIERLRKVLGQIASSHHVGNAWAQDKAARALNQHETAP